MELDTVPQPALEQLDRVQGADLLVGLLSSEGNGRGTAAAAVVRQALEAFPQPPPRTVLLLDDSSGSPRLAEEQSLPVLFCRLANAGVPTASPQAIVTAYQTVFGISRRIGARACSVIASELQTVTPMWIDRLVRPVLDMGFDLVAPRYARHRWEGLINRAILAPLNRALYGRAIQNPLGPDFGLSGNLMKSILEDLPGPRAASSGRSVPSVVSTAMRGNFQICEAQLGPRAQPPADWMNLSSLLAQILGPVFLDMERNAAVWQRVRDTQIVPAFGGSDQAPEESGAVDAGRLIDSFQLGARNLQDIWALALPPTAMLEIRKLARVPPEQFRIQDDVWASIVYDFALAHRVRTINRDHLLRSFTPLYLGWVASYALEMAGKDPLEVEPRLELLARAYEAGKPYLVSRWRWPDRFNP
ncbi:MAG TPA: hypothetical protein VMH28_05370 [Candidatus Acidoferrales bacterium]|nr:hypothetical protein [Candidatus Acidoferrales bacterium]